MKYVIVSDIHLKYFEDEEALERKLKVEAFFKSLIGKIDCLILAGDIFDLWIEWETVIIKNYFSTLKILSEIKDSGCKIIFLTGNHDFWLDKFLQTNIFVEIYHDFYESVVNEKRIFVSHGDLYTKNDIRYKIFRKVIRSFIVKGFCKILNPNIVLYLGNKISRSSRSRKIDDNLIKKKEQGLLLQARKLSENYDLIIFGHTHNPVKIELGNALYINCGDWIYHNSYCYFDEEVCELRTYDDV